MAFAALELDPKLLRAVGKQDIQKPTPVQEACIPKALEGKDIVARARTGSGKTLAYILPIFHKLLSTPVEQHVSAWQALILVPTKELCEQVKQEAERIATGAALDITVSALTATGARQRDQLLHAGTVVVATPGRIAQALKDGTLRQQAWHASDKQKRPGLTTLVIDEADLILSMPGYTEDLQEIAPKAMDHQESIELAHTSLQPHVPRGCQCMLMSATTNDSVEKLQKLVLHNPVTLDLLHLSAASKSSSAEGSGLAASVTHCSLHCARDDKLLYIMALLKLGIVKRKALLFVNAVEAGYRLRLFLERFGIKSAAISAELPMNSRHHILQEFNKGIFDILIAIDQPGKRTQDRAAASLEGKKRAKRRCTEADEEFGVTRGVDFKGVETVVNVDSAPSISSYVHRVGRTGRAGNSGTAISLFTPDDAGFEAALCKHLPAEQIGSELAVEERLPEFPKLPMPVIDALRYRAEDVARSLTTKMIREARAKELRLELLNSQRLETHFQEHPGDLALLQHDKPLAKTLDAPHLKHMPPYLRAAGMPLTTFGDGGLSVRKQRKHNKGVDPIKGGFLSAPKRGDASEPLTAMELKAEEYGKKLAKEERKKQRGMQYLPKKNVRKKR